MKKKSKVSLGVLKYYALKLRGTYQIPLYLCKLIQDLKGNEDDKYVSYLKSSAEHLLRVKGYYKKYSEAENEAEKLLNEGLKNLGLN